MDTIKWIAGKILWRIYGDKQNQVNVTGLPGAVVNVGSQIIDVELPEDVENALLEALENVEYEVMDENNWNRYWRNSLMCLYIVYQQRPTGKPTENKMNTDQQIEALKKEFAVLWDKAMKLHDESEDRALEAIKTAVKDVQEQLDALEEDRYTAQFDANWDRIADNH